MNNSDENNKLIIVGKISSSHGLNGWMKLISYTENKSNIFKYRNWYIKSNFCNYRKFVYKYFFYKNNYLIKFHNINNINDSKFILNKNIYTNYYNFPKLYNNEYYKVDLINFSVKNLNNIFLGKIIYFIEVYSNDILVIKNEFNKEVLIPFIFKYTIKKIFLSKKIIIVDWDINY